MDIRLSFVVIHSSFNGQTVAIELSFGMMLNSIRKSVKISGWNGTDCLRPNGFLGEGRLSKILNYSGVANKYLGLMY